MQYRSWALIVCAIMLCGCGYAGQWRALRESAKNYAKEGHARPAARCYERAYDDATFWGASDQQKAELLREMASFYADAGDTQKADLRYKQAIELFMKVNPSSKELVDTMLYRAQLLDKAGSSAEAEQVMAAALPVVEKVTGRGLITAGFFIDYARYAKKAGDADKATRAVETAIQISNDQSNSLEDRRKHLTRILLAIGELFEQSGEFHRAAEYYQKAIYQGESLWYPKYGWSATALDRYATMLEGQGRTADAEKYRDRLRIVMDTNKDPAGKDVSKFWNGEQSTDAPLPPYPARSSTGSSR